MIDQYYEILGIGKSTTLAEIKKAYRLKARELHPDVNKNPDAHEKFILLNEAYEYFQKAKTGRVFNSREQAYTKTRSTYKSYQNWQEGEMEEARSRAEEHSQMGYGPFMETEFYKTTVSLNLIADLFSLVSVLIIFAMPIIGYLLGDIRGLVIGSIGVFLTVPHWANVLIHNPPDLSYRDMGPSIIHLLGVKKF